MGKTKTAFVGGLDEKPQPKERKKAKEKPEKVHISGLKGGQRIKTIDSGPIVQEEEVKEKEKKEGKKAKAPRKRGKKWQAAKGKINRETPYEIDKAIKLAKEGSYSKFDGTMELHLVVKKVGTAINVSLPHSSGKEKKLEVASEETIKKLTLGKIDFDILVATPDIMPKLVPFARILGPKGLMPNPKNGTLVTDIKKAKNFSVDTKTLKTEKEAPLIHTTLGKVSQKESELVENAEAIFKALGGGKQILKAYTKATMGPAVKIKIS